MLTSPIFAVTCSQEPIKLILELKNLRTLELSGPLTSGAPVTRRSSHPIVTPLYSPWLLHRRLSN